MTSRSFIRYGTLRCAIVRGIIALLFFVTYMNIFTAQAFALEVTSLRFGAQGNNKTRLVLDLDASAPYRVFTLDNPYRLVIDLPTFAWQAGRVDNRPRAHVKTMRQGNLSPGISRAVFDMSTPIRIDSVFGLSNPRRLVIDYHPITAAAYAKLNSRIYGDLTEGNIASFAQKNAARNAPSHGAANLVHNTAPSMNAESGNHHDTPVPQAKPRGVQKNTAPAYKPLIVIDPGHGGVDPGAIGSGKRYEKTAVLALSQELRDQLLATGKYRVAMTRDTDVFIKLRNRVKFARKRGADLFVSIHADSVDKPDVRGASFYTLSNKASDAQTAKLAARENKADLIAGIDLSVEDEDVANILMDLATRDTMNQSRFFAGKLVKSFNAAGIKTLKKPHRYAGFAVLKAPDIPSVLIEAGFMSNAAEAKKLNTKSYRRSLARTIKTGIDAYFDQVERNKL